MKPLAKHLILLLILVILALSSFSCGDDDDDDDDDDVPVDDDDDDDTGDDDDDDDDDDDNDDDVTPPTTEGFVYVPNGTFTMGSPTGEIGRRDNEATHQVTLTRDIEMMAHEVTQEQYENLMDANPAYFPRIGTDLTRPVETVSWFDALAYANELSEASGYAACYALTDIVCADETAGDTDNYCKDNGGIFDASVDLNGVDSVYACEGFRLPTESEWEYAARAGTTTALPSGDVTNPACMPLDPNLDAIGWYCANAEKETHPVGEKSPNDWGLYDMSGNVFEWTGDWYAHDYPGDVSDPKGPADGWFRITRGGSVRFEGAGRCRSAFRAAYHPGFHEWYIGFRLVRTLPGMPGKSFVAPRPPASAGPVDQKPKDLPDGLPFVYTRPDVGTPLTQNEIDDFTKKITGLWKDVDYFGWLTWTGHGMHASNPDGFDDFKMYWQDTRAIKSGSLVTFEHYGGADNIMIRTPKIINNAGALYLMTGDPKIAYLVEQYCKGLVAMFRGMLWDEQDPEDFITARATFTTDHTYTEDGRQTAVTYGPAKVYKEDWNAHTIPNPNNPYWGDMWVRNMRSKDDVPHIFRSIPMLMRLVDEGQDTSVVDAAALTLDYLLGFAKDITDSGFHIRTKDMYGNPYIPREDNGLIKDLASFVLYQPILSNAECNNSLAAALIAYGDPLGIDCGKGIGYLYEAVATWGHHFNYDIIRYFHVATVTNALMVGQNDIAKKLLKGLAKRADFMMYNDQLEAAHPDWNADASSFLLISATAGLPLTSDEARQIVEQYANAADHYVTWPNWDLWDASVPDGTYDYKPGRTGAYGTVVRPEELVYLVEYCYSPFRNEDGADLINCDIVADPDQWGE